jgi:hypothetical protein
MPTSICSIAGDRHLGKPAYQVTPGIEGATFNL